MKKRTSCLVMFFLIAEVILTLITSCTPYIAPEDRRQFRPIRSVDINITAPVIGEVPIMIANGTGEFTIDSMIWSPEHAVFLDSTEYTAKITLSAKEHYSFNELHSTKINGRMNAEVEKNNNGTNVILSYTFGQTAAKKVSRIEIKKQPNTLLYTHKDKLDLSGIAITLHYTDSTVDDVEFEEFDIHGLTIISVHGKELELSHSEHNNKPIVVALGSLTVNTDNLRVNKASAPSITWPFASTIIYGSALSTSILSGGSTSCGIFEWFDGSVIPTVMNSGYNVTFTPNQDTLDNYETIMQTTQNIPITVNKASGASVSTPTVQGTPTVNSITINTVTLQTDTGQSIEYAINTNATEPVNNWYSASATDVLFNAVTITFSKLEEGTTYYIFARTMENDNYLTDTPSVSAGITTLGQRSFDISFEQFLNDDAVLPWNGSGGSILIPINSDVLITFALVIDEVVHYTSVDWYVDNILKSNGKQASFSLKSSDFTRSDVGTHSLTVEIVLDGKYYNRTIPFQVLTN